MRTLVVAPTYIEAENVQELLPRLRAAVPAADILVVDDSSPDGTAAAAEEIARELGQIDVLVRPVKTGLGAAYRDGFTIGLERGYEALAQIDSDLSHDPTALPRLLGAVEDGADLTIGSRYVAGGEIPHWPAFRRALSKYGNKYSNLALRTGVRDLTSGFRVYRADTLKAVDFGSTRSLGYGFQIELAYRVKQWGGRIVEVPIVFTDRVRGNSKMSWQVAAEEMRFVTWWGLRDRFGRNRGRYP